MISGKKEQVFLNETEQKVKKEKKLHIPLTKACKSHLSEIYGRQRPEKNEFPKKNKQDFAVYVPPKNITFISGSQCGPKLAKQEAPNITTGSYE